MQIKHLCFYRNYRTNWTTFLNCRSEHLLQYLLFFFHQVLLPHLHPLSLLQGSMAGSPSDDLCHSTPVERAAAQHYRGVCFTKLPFHRGNILEFSFPARPERLHPMVILQKPPSSVSWQAVIQKFQIQQSTIAAFWRGKTNIHPTLLLG